MKKPSEGSLNLAKRRICAAALELAARRGWNVVSPRDAARLAKIPAKTAENIFPRRDDMIPAIVAMIDDEMAASFSAQKGGCPHDRLFDAAMARFESLQLRRDGIKAISSACMNDPRLLAQLALAHARSARRIIETAIADDDAPKMAVLSFALFVAHEAAILNWLRDDTPDMARTMAFLDRALRRVCRAAF